MRFITPTKTRIALAVAGIACIILIVAVASGNSFFGISMRNDTLADGLIGHWTFDGKYMTPGVQDASGNELHGTLSGFSATTTVIGKIGQALDFDGVNDYVNIGDIDLTTAMSASAWFYVDSFSTGGLLNKGIVSRHIGDAGSNRSWSLYVDLQTSGSNPRLGAALSSNGTNQASNNLVGTTMLQEGRWYHAVLTYDANDKTIIYIDGAQEATDATPPASLHLNDIPAKIGTQYTATDNRFFLDGKIDDVRIYNRALTPEEVQRLYSLGEGVKIDASRATGGLGNGADSGLVGHWTFDGKYMNPNPQDSSGLGKHGVLTNFAANPGIIGPIGQALAFDSATDYVQIDNPDMPTGDFTISAWVRMTSFAGSPTIVMIGNGSNGVAGNEIWWGFDTSGRLGHNFDGTSGAESNTLLSLNTWAHAVLRRSGSAVEMFLDGMLVSTFTRAQTLNFSTCPLFLGTDADSGCSGNLGNYFHGQMDDVRVYDRALSNEEVIVLYNMRGGTKIATTPQGGDLSNTVGADPYGHWTFDLADLVSGVQDVSGNGHHGQLILGSNGNTATTTATGVRGEALVFDGNDDRVQIDSPNLPTGDFTISFWAKADSYSGGPALLMIGNGANGTGGNEIYIAFHTTGQLRYLVDGGDTFESAKALPVGTWGHILLRRTGSTVDLLLDGVKILTSTSAGTYNYGSCPLHLGVDPDSGCSGSLTQFLNGQLDDFRVYDYALSDGEVQALYLGDSGNASSDLIAHWTFDGKYMTPGVQDASGNNLHGTLSGFSATTTVIGRIGQALDFDGTNNYVSVPDTTALDFGTGNITMSAWFKAPNENQYRTIVVKRNPSSPFTQAGLFICTINSGGTCSASKKLTGIFYGGSLGSALFVHTTNDVVDGEWHLATVVRTGAASAKIYIDGVEVATTVQLAAGTPNVNNNNPLMIGNDGSSHFFSGAIDDVRIYGRALTAIEIERLYNMGR